MILQGLLATLLRQGPRDGKAARRPQEDLSPHAQPTARLSFADPSTHLPQSTSRQRGNSTSELDVYVCALAQARGRFLATADINVGKAVAEIDLPHAQHVGLVLHPGGGDLLFAEEAAKHSTDFVVDLLVSGIAAHPFMLSKELPESWTSLVAYSEQLAEGCNLRKQEADSVKRAHMLSTAFFLISSLRDSGLTPPPEKIKMATKCLTTGATNSLRWALEDSALGKHLMLRPIRRKPFLAIFLIMVRLITDWDSHRLGLVQAGTGTDWG